MDKTKDEAINKLINGQEKMGKDISEMKTDISEIKIEQSGMKKDISEIKTEQSGMKKDISDLKVNQQQFEDLIHKVLDGMARIERVVINIENDLRPKVHTLLDADKIRQDDTAELKQICREQEKQLTNHELRISRLEK